ncbi:MAG: prolyl aminopeptidase [Alcanivoracaceae bacterium]|nr:prolyl aminopeptidase [Alcanivoracaceae bacterium]
MSLYPEIEPFDQFQLQVDEIHSLYVERCGNPNGEPVLVLHGGPGGGCSPALRRFFDPEKWHIILFDQRGAGRSRPYAGLLNNALLPLLDDIEKIRQRLSLERWSLFGGSWGSTLALHYGLAHPERVAAMVLRGIFLARPQDLDWLYRAGGASAMKPDAWDAFLAPLSEDQQHDPLTAYYRVLADDDHVDLTRYAQAWSAWEATCATLLPNDAVRAGFSHAALAIARIETHFFAGAGMADAAPILPRMAKLADTPSWLIHGRYDLVCMPEQAMALHKQWPSSTLRWVEAAGHSAMEPDICAALASATEEMYVKVKEL